MRAIISDVHGNLEALEAVLTDAQRHGVTSIFCLGDLVGYGPDPIPCIRRAMAWDVVLMGNFDEAAVNGQMQGWSALHAKRTVLAFRASLGNRGLWSTLGEFLRTRPSTFTTEEAFHVHGSAREPLYEYLYAQHVTDRGKMDAIARCFDALCSCGHTHIPGVFYIDEADEWRHVPPEECGHSFESSHSKVICNVGSVGQPRDRDPRASYVLFDGTTITFRRVDYDIESTIAKTRADDEFHDFLAERLREGR